MCALAIMLLPEHSWGISGQIQVAEEEEGGRLIFLKNGKKTLKENLLQQAEAFFGTSYTQMFANWTRNSPAFVAICVWRCR